MGAGTHAWVNFPIIDYRRLGGELGVSSFGAVEIANLTSPYLETAYATTIVRSSPSCWVELALLFVGAS